MNAVTYGSLFLRAALGITMVAHGYNHAFGGGKLPGTARWFESIGIRPGKFHALTATVTELGAGIMLLLGFLTPLAAAGVAGTMTVALISNHLKNGFFIFRPGEGYEYVLFILLSSFAMGAIGGGRVSLDNAFGFLRHSAFYGGWGVLIVLLGAIGGLGLLAACWRPNAKPAEPAAA